MQLVDVSVYIVVARNEAMGAQNDEVCFRPDHH